MEIKVPKTCEVACVVKMKKSDKDSFVRAIDDEYRVHWAVDNLPVGKFICQEYHGMISELFSIFPISIRSICDVKLHVPLLSKFFSRFLSHLSSPLCSYLICCIFIFQHSSILPLHFLPESLQDIQH